MKRSKLKFKELLNEYRSLCSEWELTQEIMRESLKEFDQYLNDYIKKEEVDISGLKLKHSKRVEKIFDSKPTVQQAALVEHKKKLYDAKKIFRKIAKMFHPDTIALDDPRQEEYESIFQTASNAINEGKWGELFNIVDKYDLDFDDYDSAIECLKSDIDYLTQKIEQKKSTYAWLFYECENDDSKEKLMHEYLNYVYIDYRDIS